ncbi:MAG: nucleoside 2-deoxyribosyltransferase [Methanoculleaceae archaeon]
MYVLICPCMCDPGLRARGITGEEDRRWFERALERCRRCGIEAVPLPCPETLYLGRGRAPVSGTEALDTPEFRRLLDHLETEVRELVDERGPPVYLIGVDASPTCGVNRTHREGRRVPGRGLFFSRFPDLPAVDVCEFGTDRIYLAAPLFSEAEERYNSLIARDLVSRGFEVYLPQEWEDTDPCREGRVPAEIFRRNLAALEWADTVVAIIDGPDADSGTAWEMGYATASGKRVVALRTDFRRVSPCERVNLMLEESAVVVEDRADLPAAAGVPLPPQRGRDPP